MLLRRTENGGSFPLGIPTSALWTQLLRLLRDRARTSPPVPIAVASSRIWCLECLGPWFQRAEPWEEPAWKHDWFSCISLSVHGSCDGRGRGNAPRLITITSGSWGSLTNGHRNNTVSMGVEGKVLDMVGGSQIFPPATCMKGWECGCMMHYFKQVCLAIRSGGKLIFFWCISQLFGLFLSRHRGMPLNRYGGSRENRPEKRPRVDSREKFDFLSIFHFLRSYWMGDLIISWKNLFLCLYSYMFNIHSKSVLSKFTVHLAVGGEMGLQHIAWNYECNILPRKIIFP